MIKMWIILDEKPYIKPTPEMKQKLNCIFCGEKLILRRVGIPRIRESGGFAMDIAYKCPKCDWFVIFGVVIPEDKAKHLKKKMQNKQYIPEDIWLHSEKVKERLESWGYW